MIPIIPYKHYSWVGGSTKGISSLFESYVRPLGYKVTGGLFRSQSGPDKGLPALVAVVGPLGFLWAIIYSPSA